MFRVHCLLPRADAERLSGILAELDPSPASAASVEEASRVSWSLDALCTDEDLAREAAAIIEREAPGVSVSVQKLEDKDWVAVSLAGLPAVHAGPFVVAGWHELAHLEGGRIPVWIEAGPAFGTGHHGTTKGCLQALALELDRKLPRRVLDIGTGSAVLALAAVKRGVKYALGTDMDAESIRIAHENVSYQENDNATLKYNDKSPKKNQEPANNDVKRVRKKPKGMKDLMLGNTRCFL